MLVLYSTDQLSKEAWFIARWLEMEILVVLVLLSTLSKRNMERHIKLPKKNVLDTFRREWGQVSENTKNGCVAKS